MRKMMRKVMMNPPSPFSCNGRLMGAGTMPRSLTRAEDWARAETFAKRTSFHSRIWAEPAQLFCSANYLDGEGASWKTARDEKPASGLGGRELVLNAPQHRAGRSAGPREGNPLTALPNPGRSRKSPRLETHQPCLPARCYSIQNLGAGGSRFNPKSKVGSRRSSRIT